MTSKFSWQDLPWKPQGKGEQIIVSYADYLITSLLVAAPSELTAGFSPGENLISWRLRNLESGEERIADTLKGVLFRPVLARIAIRFMSGCVYGGYRRFHLRAGDFIYPVAFYLGNDSLNGFWFRGRCGAGIADDGSAAIWRTESVAVIELANMF